MKNRRRHSPGTPSPVWGRHARRVTGVALPSHVSRLAVAMIGFGGVPARVVYRRLQLARRGMKLIDFQRYANAIRDKANLAGCDGSVGRELAVTRLLAALLSLLWRGEEAGSVIERLGESLRRHAQVNASEAGCVKSTP